MSLLSTKTQQKAGEHLLQSISNMSNNWSDSEIRDLLTVRGDMVIMKSIQGTARDSVTYDRLVTKLRELGTHRSKQQAISKLKTLKRRYREVCDHNRKSGNDRMEWNYFELCEAIWGAQKTINPAVVCGSMAAASNQPEDCSEASCSSVERAQEDTTDSSENHRPQDASDSDYSSVAGPSCSAPTQPACSTPRQKKRKRDKSSLTEWSEAFEWMDERSHQRDRELMQEQREFEEHYMRENLALRRQEAAAFQDMASLMRELVNRFTRPQHE
ncbi:zinc finger and SCAN domain-containing protein 29-like [Nothobranchius furzeri]|uniref:LOC107374303-like protein n=2 Tax=Nothobranchius furzeri TaxID=105023 RepID=A0A9D2XD95_NOTFU|nr:putative LOC107374303-like protein [Nothobranchius furzeri]